MQWGNADELQSKKQLSAPFPKGGRVPSSASSFCSSLFALRGKEEVLNLFSFLTAEWDPGCFTLISCAAGGAFLAEPCKKQESRYWGRAEPGSVGEAIALRQSSRVNVEPAEGRREEGISAVNRDKRGKVRGENGGGGVRRGGEDKRGQEGFIFPSESDQVVLSKATRSQTAVYCAASADRVLGWTSADRIIEWMEQIKLSMGTNSRSSSQSIRSGPILNTLPIRVMYGDRQRQT